MDTEKIQEIIGYTFNDIRLLKQAMTHRSYMSMFKRDPEIASHNERLEFLGDAVLELIVTDYLYSTYDFPEGKMTNLRASIVNYRLMGKVGIEMGLDYHILMSKSEAGDEGRARLTIVADAIEAILGAIYLDSQAKGYSACEDFVRINLLSKLPDIIANKTYRDYKTILQEHTQKTLKTTPKYKIISTEGKDHEKTFFIGVWIKGVFYAKASGKTKQQAETKAAKMTLDIIAEREKEALTTDV